MGSGVEIGAALLTLQVVHTLVYAAGQASVVLILWSGLTGRPVALLKYALICIGIIVACRAVNGGVCPLYTLARWLVDAGPNEVVQDMLTPVWFNDIVTPVNVPFAVAGFLLIAWRSVTGRWSPRSSPVLLPAADARPESGRGIETEVR